MKKTFSFDVDGVLGNFYLHACRRYNKPYVVIHNWSIDWLKGKYWTDIAEDEDFWYTIPILSHPESIRVKVDCYLTSCPPQMKEVREDWLKKHGFPDAPVIISKQKDIVCSSMGIDFHVEDKPNNVKKIDNYGGGTTCFQFIPYYSKWELKTRKTLRHLSQIEELAKMKELL